LINFLLITQNTNFEKIQEWAINQHKQILDLDAIKFKTIYNKYKYVSKLRNIHYYNSNLPQILINNWYKKYSYKEFVPIY
jgi:hypothetical protein